MGGRIKGAPLRAMCEEWAARRSVDEVLEAIHRLPETERFSTFPDPLRTGFGVLPSGWYSAIVGAQVLESLFEQLPPEQTTEMIEVLARGIMARTLRGVHRALFRIVGSPELMRKRGQLFWKKQFDTGVVAISQGKPGEQLHVYREWSGHHRLFCLISFHCVPVMFEQMGVAPPIRVEPIRCAADGSGECAAFVRWNV